VSEHTRLQALAQVRAMIRADIDDQVRRQLEAGLTDEAEARAAALAQWHAWVEEAAGA
jgi:hypothetical protein